MNCYLLLGGESTRMGRPKAAVELGGKTFLERALDAAASAFDRVLAVRRAAESAIPGLTTIFERKHRGSGAIFGLERALEDAGEGKLWLLAIDYPLMTSSLLGELRRRFEGSGADLLVPRWDGKPQLLCAGYHTALLPAVRSAIAAGRYTLRGIAESARIEIVDEGDLRRRREGEPLLNVNDPTDLARARRLVEDR
ncbi:MAG TPA: molybdenum cofactor guanylyltransferase [Thermoanaerobaculia bacterium]|nr:molybdenum cofactor guanylyltransferase [Thermoanaerobaculia bacterium]